MHLAKRFSSFFCSKRFVRSPRYSQTPQAKFCSRFIVSFFKSYSAFSSQKRVECELIPIESRYYLFDPTKLFNYCFVRFYKLVIGFLESIWACYFVSIPIYLCSGLGIFDPSRFYSIFFFHFLFLL